MSVKSNFPFPWLQKSQMKYLLALLFFASLQAKAEWIDVAESESGVIFYVDKETIKKEGNLVKVWVLINYKKAGRSGQLSSKHKQEYDCAKERTRDVSVTGYSRNMGKGDVIATGHYLSEWSEIAPDTVQREVMQFVCKNRAIGK